jgi:hypothetical protein
MSKLTTSNISKERKLIFLSVPRDKYTISGSYYRIMVPSISLEWHSYSVINSEIVDQLLFLIDVRSDWTRNLYDQISKKTNNYVIVQGPFMTVFSDILATDKEHCICIADGKTGISPFLSVMDTKIQISRCNLEYRENYALMFGHKMQQKQAMTLFDIIENHTTNTPVRYPLKVIWIFNDLTTVEYLFDYIKYLLTDSTNVYLDIYITEHFMCNARIKQIFRILHLLEGSNDYIKIFFQKPNFISIMNDERPNTVYFSGSNQLFRDIRTVCNDNEIRIKY